MLIKTQRLTISPFFPRNPIKSHQPLIPCLGGDSVLTRRKLSAITTATPIFRGYPVVTRREIKAGRVTRNCINNDRGIEAEEKEDEKTRVLVKETVWEQMKDIVKFTGPAMGMWVCGPLMSLIDTVVIGQGSSVELAALGDLKCMELRGAWEEKSKAQGTKGKQACWISASISVMEADTSLRQEDIG